MGNFYFFVKSILIGVGISATIGGLIGFISSMIHTDHAHQVLPTWMMIGMLGAMIGFISSVIVSIYMTYFGKQSYRDMAAITALVAVIILATIAFVYL